MTASEEVVRRAVVVADKHEQAVQRLVAEIDDLPRDLAEALKASGAAAAQLRDLAEQWLSRFD